MIKTVFAKAGMYKSLTELVLNNGTVFSITFKGTDCVRQSRNGIMLENMLIDLSPSQFLPYIMKALVMIA